MRRRVFFHFFSPSLRRKEKTRKRLTLLSFSFSPKTLLSSLQEGSRGRRRPDKCLRSPGREDRHQLGARPEICRRRGECFRSVSFFSNFLLSREGPGRFPALAFSLSFSLNQPIPLTNNNNNNNNTKKGALAFVIAHEVGHVLARHSAEQLTLQGATQLVATVAQGVAMAAAAAAAAQGQPGVQMPRGESWKGGGEEKREERNSRTHSLARSLTHTNSTQNQKLSSSIRPDKGRSRGPQLLARDGPLPPALPRAGVRGRPHRRRAL